MDNGKTAIVIGATGLVGTQLVNQLIKDDEFSKIVVLVRRSTSFKSSKIEEVIVDFDHIDSASSAINGDVLFSAMGTTIGKAKTKENQYKIDYTYQYKTAKIAANNGVPIYVLVSSTSADSKSRIFYSRMKGELEDSVSLLDFKSIKIVRPSLLLGEREEFRLGEKIGAVVMAGLKYLPFLNKWRGITGSEVAMAMIAYSKKQTPNKIEIRELDELFRP